MEIPSEIFKAYDIRGVVDRTLTETIVELIGWGIGNCAKSAGDKAVIVGWDGRSSGPSLSRALANGIQTTGCDVILIGMVPTPIIYFATHHLGINSAVAVTGSHNPPEYNGLKIVIGGKTLVGHEIQMLKETLNRRTDSPNPGSLHHECVTNNYIERIVSDIHLNRSLSIVIDSGNGVAGTVAPLLYRKLGCEVTELFSDVDGQFPNHHADPSQPENLKDLSQAMIGKDMDIGLAFDGDGDRLGVMSPTGEIIWPDRQLLLFANDILINNPGAEIIYDVKCTRLLPEAILAAGGKATMSKTGHSFIKAKLRESDAILAGEMSGHIFFNDRWYGFDDALYAGVRLCELISRHNGPPAEVFNMLPNTVNTPEIKLEIPDRDHHMLIRGLVESATFPSGHITTIDGLRVDYGDGFGLVRASNTTPTITFRFEADTSKGLTKIQHEFRQQLLKFDPHLNIPF
ncbi:MAG: phosphomannomutase/phosphoglucomutase [Acidiferrobacteraceae bacterium]|nr:phosphomannomutase/phosphoglucomutase [Acidiferrobacteraceae bacterium]|tara:strand:- start:1149 stop:2522 length:1374 start_codon:yes stop_codon:yes gene_type:complete